MYPTPAKRTFGEWRRMMIETMWLAVRIVFALVCFWTVLSITVKVIVVSAITAAFHANQYLTKESSSGNAT